MTDTPRAQPTSTRAMMGVAAATAIGIAVWTVLIFAVPQLHFATLAPRAQIGLEAASACARLFGALVLFLFPGEIAQRLRWVGGGFVVLALGDIAFGYLPPVLGRALPLNTSMYAFLVVRSVAALLFALGLLPETAPPFSWRPLLVALGLFAALGGAVVVAAAMLPRLVEGTDLAAAAARGDVPLRGLTAWHWALATLPLALAGAAALGAARQARRGAVSGWLLPAMVLLAGSQLHNTFWPSAFSPVVTTADLLRFAFALVVAVGGSLELRRIALERTALLAAERERTEQLRTLARMKADFTAMVAHELGSPLAAVEGYAAMLATSGLASAEQAQALRALLAEAALLQNLAADVRGAATAERDDFAVAPRPISLCALLGDAARYAATLPGDHPLDLRRASDACVLADPSRIGQVLRNLLGNAAKFSPPCTPIALQATLEGARVRIAVADTGPGIHPDDRALIFEKFGRGRDRTGRAPAGSGLGLYVARRIVQAHGTDLRVQPGPEGGALFSFELERVQ